MSDEPVQGKKSFFHDKYNLILLGILVLGLILRLIYFNVNQALWWDESEYLSIAKHWALNVPFDVSYVRPPLFPVIAAFFYMLGANEFVLRLFMVVISMAGIYLTYLVAKELFNNKVALVSSFLMSISYLALFYTARIMIDVLMMVLWLLAIWFFWKGYVKKGSKYYLWLMGITIGLGSSLKMPFVLIGIPFLLYVFLNEGFSMFKNRQLWLSLLFFFLAIAPYFIYYNLSYGGLPFISTSSYGFGQGILKFGFYASVIPLILQSQIPFLSKASPWFFNIFLLMFFFGFGYMLINLFIGWDLIKKEHSLKVYAFLLAWMVILYVFFSMIEMAEDRYLFMIYPAVFMVAGFVFLKCYDFLKKHNKFIALAFVLLVFFDAAYYQVSYADTLIKSKASSYVQFRDAGLWMKDRAAKEDIIFNSGIPQNTYYSELNTSTYPDTAEQFEKMVMDYKPKFMVLSGLERSPEWSYAWPQEHPDLVVPVQAYYADEAKKQPMLVVYEFINNSTLIAT